MSHFDPSMIPANMWPAIDSQGHAPSEPQKTTEDNNEHEDDSPAPRPEGLEPVFAEDFDHIFMLDSVFDEARAYFAARRPEAACLLLGPKNHDLVTHMLTDEEGRATPVSFTLAAASLNRQVKPYLAAGCDIKGIWHLHPPGVTSLSYGDITYVRNLFLNSKNSSLDRFLMPITAGGRFYGFVVTRSEDELTIRRARPVLQ